jgi:hypothetical protein
MRTAAFEIDNVYTQIGTGIAEGEAQKLKPTVGNDKLRNTMARPAIFEAGNASQILDANGMYKSALDRRKARPIETNMKPQDGARGSIYEKRQPRPVPLALTIENDCIDQCMVDFDLLQRNCWQRSAPCLALYSS